MIVYLAIAITFTLRLQLISTKNIYGKYPIGIVTFNETLIAHDDELFDFKLIDLKDNDISNPIEISLVACERLIAKWKVYSIVLLDFHKKFPTDIFGQIASYYSIPIISLYNRYSLFSNKQMYTSFIRLKPAFFNDAKIWVNIIEHFEWKSINLIHSNNEEGKTFEALFQEYADQRNLRIVEDIEYGSNDDNFKKIITSLTESNSKIVLLQANPFDAERIINQAEESNLLTSGYVWLVTETALDDLKSFKLRNGLITLRHHQVFDPLHAAISQLEKTFKKVNKVELYEPSVGSCRETGLNWDTGKTLYNLFIQNEDQSMSFDINGDIKEANYEILNVNENKLHKIGTYNLSKNEFKIELDESKITWIGGLMQKPDGTKWSTKFKIVTIEEKPFVYKFEKPNDYSCFELNKDSIDCPWRNNNISKDYCCYGYCIDLIKYVSKNLSIDFDVHLVADGLIGDYDPKTGWNGLIGEVLSEKADIILAPFTVNPDRLKVLEFTNPYKYQGIRILVKRVIFIPFLAFLGAIFFLLKNTKDSNFSSFLQPFQNSLWLMVILCVHIVAVVLYLQDKFSIFNVGNKKDSSHQSDYFSLSLWFTWGILLNSGIGEGTPRSLSGRFLGIVWAGFAMIMVASYTANLAAFLVLDRPEALISGINDARLRNPQENFKFATIRGSSVEKYFKRQVELSTMYRTMENYNYNNTEDALRDLKEGKIQAFIWDSSRLEYEAAKSCDFITVGELFGKSSYGLALKKGNPWINKLSMIILILHETGIMEDLDSKWILFSNQTCVKQDSSPSTLGITNMAGVFMLVAGGSISGIFLIFIELLYRKYSDKRARRNAIVQSAFILWKTNVKKRKMALALISDSKFIPKKHQNGVFLKNIDNFV